MSTKKITEEKITVVSEATLKEIPYHDLKDELAKLGLGSVWKGGKKKADMIKEALEKIGEVQKLQEIELSQKQIDEQLAIKDAEKAAEEKKNIEKAKEQKVIQEAIVVEKEKEGAKDPETKEYDIPKLYRSLKLTRANIKGGPSTHIPELRKREQTLVDILKEAGENIN